MKGRKVKARSKSHERTIQRNIRISQRTPSANAELDAFAWEELGALRIDRIAATGIGWEIDHMLPVAGDHVSGLHTHTNWQLIPALLNGMKGDREVLTEPDEWLLYADNFMRLSADMFSGRLRFNGNSTRRKPPHRGKKP